MTEDRPNTLPKCLHCSKEIASEEEHAELCPNNFLHGIQLSHGLPLADHRSLIARHPADPDPS